MKKLNLFLALVFAACFVQAQDDIEVKSKIDAVTVFLSGAQVSRSADVPVKKGRNIVYFRGLGEGINPSSIQASAPQAFLINSVIHEINYLDKAIEAPKVKVWQDSLEIIQKLVENNSMENGVLETEKQMILRNQSIASKEQGLNIDELVKTSDFFRSRLTEIYDRQLTYARANAKLNARRNAISNQLNELNARRNRPSNDIRVVVNADNAGTANVNLTYFISGAGWTPGYNIRAKDTQSPMVLEYKADVYQNTGTDWENVKLTLSSGNPNTGGTQPVLSPWNLYVQEPIVLTTVTTKGYSREAAAAPAMAPKIVYDSDEITDEEPDASSSDGEVLATGTLTDQGAYSYTWQPTSLATYTTVQEGATTAEFRISIPQTIRSNGKAEQVSVKTAELQAQYRHYAVPKLDNDAFLVAGLTGWDTLNLLPGNAQVFFEGTYVTEVSINPAYTSDTLNVSLGRDKKVVIERTQLKDFNKVRTLGANRERTFAYEIKIRNTKDAAVTLFLEDQIPVTQDKDISVTLVDASGAKKDDATGKLTWELNLAKAETKTVKLMFSVKYPKNKFIPGI
jgi:uncharacterized protein (TIGR02231 family)